MAEPYYISESRSDRLGDIVGSVAIVVSSAADSLPFSAHGRGLRGGLVGVYFSPNQSLADFEQFLDQVGTVVTRSLSRPVLVMGDLNAKAADWGSPRTDAKDEALVDWAAGLDLLVMNTDTAQTFVRRRGGGVHRGRYVRVPHCRATCVGLVG